MEDIVDAEQNLRMIEEKCRRARASLVAGLTFGEITPEDRVIDELIRIFDIKPEEWMP